MEKRELEPDLNKEGLGLTEPAGSLMQAELVGRMELAEVVESVGNLAHGKLEVRIEQTELVAP